MSSRAKFSVNPFPWFADGPDSWTLTAQTVTEAIGGVADAGFASIAADLPANMTPTAYAELLDARGLRPSPCYWGIFFDCGEGALPAIREEAKKRAAAQTALGVDGIIIADELYPARRARPGTGKDFDQDRLDRLIENVADIASVLTAEGLTPYFHPHVASWIETDAEVRALLDAVDPKTLAFGPDVAHLAWAGADPVKLIGDYTDRVGLIHLKDAHLAAVERVREQGLSYDAAVYENHVFTEPGRGDIDLAAVVAAVPNDYEGWWVTEVDVPDLPSKEESTLASARWMLEHIPGAESAQPGLTLRARL